jgi:dTDP-4-amino-4,6-dideoxygalactose transaminase
MISYGKQDINQINIDEFVGDLSSDFLTQESRTPLFEQIVANYCSSRYAVAVNSATSATL